MTRLAVMSDLHIDINHFETYEIDTLIKCLKKMCIRDRYMHNHGGIQDFQINL